MNQSRSTEKKERVFWLTGLLFFVLLGSGAASIYFLFQLNNELKEIVEDELPITESTTRITLYKLEQTYWLERAFRHAEIAALGQQGEEDNTRLLGEAQDKFKEIAFKVSEEIANALAISRDAQKEAHTEHMSNELKNIEKSLSSIQQEYARYNNHVVEMFSLFSAGKMGEAKRLINETEKLEDDFNQTLEGFLLESEKFTRHSLSSIRKSEDKLIIIIATIISISLLFTIAVLLSKGIFAVVRKVPIPRKEH
jgi:methyl-accepting chemotaxis protein